MSKDEKSRLELLAGGLSEDAVRKKVLDPSRKALMSYGFGDTQASSYEDFLKTGSGFVKHYMQGTEMGDISDERAQSLFQRYAGRAFEQEGGIEAAYEAARKDLFGVMQKISGRMESESRNDYVQNILSKVDPTDFDAQKEIAAGVIKAMSALNPGIKAKKPEALAHNWRQLALSYVGMRDNAQSLVGEYKAA